MNCPKLSKKHVLREWDEGHPDDGGDGYWVDLVDGWKWYGDPVGYITTIHEPTRRQCYEQHVIRETREEYEARWNNC